MPPPVEAGEIHNQCLVSWDEPPQVQSVETTITLDRQVIKTHMKALRHCVLLHLFGPVNLQNIAQDYVKKCVNDALTDDEVRNIVELMAALGFDFWTMNGGAATSAKLTEYVSAVEDKTMDCLVDQNKLADYLQEKVESTFNATTEQESHWIYWDL